MGLAAHRVAGRRHATKLSQEKFGYRGAVQAGGNSLVAHSGGHTAGGLCRSCLWGRQVKLSFVRALAQDIELVEVSRTVSADGPVVEAVLEELLKGPTPAERHQGLTTLIPEGTVVKSVSVDLDGTVHADFNEALQEGVGGSMWVMGIRRQIQASLLWIPGVTSVILSIEGRTEEILQP